MEQLNPNKVRQIFFLVIIILLGALLFYELNGFLPGFLGALTLYVILDKWMRPLVRKGYKRSSAALLLMLISFIVIVLPIVAAIKLLVSRLSISGDQINAALQSVQVFIEKTEARFGLDILNEKNLGQISSIVAKEVPVVLNATLNTLTTIVVMYFILYFMLVEGHKMEKAFFDLLPVGDDHIDQVRNEIGTMVISNAVGIPLIAVLQGVVGLIGYLILGVKDPFLWFTITCITAMIPLVGAALAYVPLAIVFFVEGVTWKGVAMLGFGFGIIGTVDNVFRFWLQKKIGDVHPLITAFGVVLGLKLLGFFGLVFGPLLISIFILLVRIYRLEFGGEDESPVTPVAPIQQGPQQEGSEGNGSPG
ncbi:AI-2E family transporter [Flavihumibacter rivuli]|uniref:AI-2E family transporter n=1 Tax=Flavihumibacter rivuli TaxID=2838156 RepID=UPI001BDE50B1|nr:AI-2E family transporter [Flavihumibacter rivuli]ULQ56038.1 AI-2E family transporter [Flavihumibacter rivuli]